MNLEIRGLGMELTDPLRSHVRRRLEYALGRFGSRILGVTVRFVGASGHRTCRVAVDTRHAGRLFVEDRDHDPYAAASRAIGRVGRSMVRSIERLRFTG